MSIERAGAEATGQHDVLAARRWTSIRSPARRPSLCSDAADEREHRHGRARGGRDRPPGAAQQTVYDLKLTDAVVGGFENDPGAERSVRRRLTFDFGKVAG